jgi:hypothetical protein
MNGKQGSKTAVMTTHQPHIPRALIVLLLVAWALLMFRANAPYFGDQDAYRVWVASAVQNFEIYGLEQTGGMMTRNSGPNEPDELLFYSHHPPMLAWVPAGHHPVHRLQRSGDALWLYRRDDDQHYGALRDRTPALQ